MDSVQGMDGMIVKGWEKIGITKGFTQNFQIKALEAIIHPSFHIYSKS
jgi:hypothetical protein